MIDKIKDILSSKKEYKALLKRANNLPEDYKFVFDKTTNYIWSYAGGDGLEMLQKNKQLLELFEEGVANNLNVLDIVGEDVAAFCDELIADTYKWTDWHRKKLNK